jgi:4-hydroxy-3-methylbut-2-enyl diphosphate reductase
MALEARLISAAAPGLEVRRTGIGPRRARAAARALADGPPLSLLVIMGFAGGLAPGASGGEVVVADELRGPAGERLACPAADLLTEVLEERGLEVRRGVVACSPRPALGRVRARLRGELGAVAADMESLWLAQTAGARSWGVVRVLADAPHAGIWRPWRGVRRFLAARRALRRVSAALADWASARESPRAEDALGLSPSSPQHGAARAFRNS